MSFPWYAVFFFAGLLGWPYFLLGAVVLGPAGLVARGRARAWLLGFAWFFLLVGTVGGFALVDRAADSVHSDAERDAFDAAMRETLTQPKQVLRTRLPAGTAVKWTDEGRVEFDALALPQPTEVFGFPLEGELGKMTQQDQWNGMLAQDFTIDGWECRKGAVAFSTERQLIECVLAVDHKAFGLTIPAGSQLQFNPGYSMHDFTLPADKGMSVPLLGATLPSLTKVKVWYDQIHELDLPDGKLLIVRGVPLRQEIQLKREGDNPSSGQTALPPSELDGSLGDFYSCNGRRFDVDSGVTLNVLTRRITIAPRIESGETQPEVDVSGCLK